VDQSTGRSHGFGYVHFISPAVEKAPPLNGTTVIDGHPVDIDESTLALNKVATRTRERRAQAFGDNVKRAPPSVLFVGNFSWSTIEG
jgi:nucleolin